MTDIRIATNQEHDEGIPEKHNGYSIVSLIAVYSDGSYIEFSPGVMEWKEGERKNHGLPK